ANHEICKMLKLDSNWIAEIIRKRNAIEHPEGHSGKMQFTNIQRAADGFVLPTWNRTTGKKSQILEDIDACLWNSLTFAEDILVNCIREKPAFPHIDLAEIPEADRDPAMPIRLRVVPTAELMTKIQPPSDLKK
ncbi:MAG: hypothetical protein AAFR21_15345, partial [Pseudomonadota bacterium]